MTEKQKIKHHLPKKKTESEDFESKNSKLTKNTLAELAIKYHQGTQFGDFKRRPGKLEVVATRPLATQRDLSLAYSPGVAEPCKLIHKNPEEVYNVTAKGNLVAVVSNGTAVLGLGDIGALAGKPVFEGKSVLFKKYADIDSIDIEVDRTNVDEFIEVVSAIEPTFGGINLEDIKAPDCFIIEETLKNKLSIPVFHDDQHGTAIISGAAIINACEVSKRSLKDVKVVFCGGGAAAISCARFWLTLGVKKENCIMTDRSGVIYKGRDKDLNSYKEEFALDGKSSWHKKMPKSLQEALVGADCFVGLSTGGVMSKDMLRGMADNPIVFAMANPDPEISFEDADGIKDNMIFATGRSDYPNQVNNVLCFPFMFRGALDVRATTVNEEMKIAASYSLAELAKQEVPESVIQSYGGEPLKFGPEYIIPKPFDPRVLIWVSAAVAKAAVESGVAQKDYPGGSETAYRESLEKLLGKSQSVMRSMKNLHRSQSKRSSKKGVSAPYKPKIVLAEGANEQVLRAAEILRAENIAEPILMGNAVDIKNMIEEMQLNNLNGCKVIHPRKNKDFKKYAKNLWELRKRKGLTIDLAEQWMKDPFYYGAMHLLEGQADAWIGGITRSYPDAIKPILRTFCCDSEGIIAGLHMLLFDQRILFFADTSVNTNPNPEKLAEIAAMSAAKVESLGFEPRIAMVSYSNFGSNDHHDPLRMREATAIIKQRYPELLVDGEMQADSAVSPEILQSRFPFSDLSKTGANILIFPNLSAANISYKLLKHLGGAELIGPMLLGVKHPAHVVPANADSDDVVNLCVMAALDAQKKRLEAEL